MVIILNYHNKILLCGLIGMLSTVYCINVEPRNPVTISLESFNKTNTNGQAFFEYTELYPSDPVTIRIVNVTLDVSFVIIQAHVQGWNVTLSMFNATDDVAFSGSNIGFKLDSTMIDKNNVSIYNNDNVTTTALIAVVAYIKDAPIPGGCDKQSLTNIFPFQKIITTNALIIINAEPASAPFMDHQLSCDNVNSITYEVYRLYASHYDFTNETYFSAISKMLTVDDIIKNGKKIPVLISSSSIKVSYSAYFGIGSAYAIIAKYDNYSAAYVPAFSYGCDPIFDEESCYFLNSTIAKALCVAIFCSGVLLILVGKVFFHGPMVFISLFGGSTIGYIVLCVFKVNDIKWLFGGSILIGIIISLVVVIMWCIMPCIVFLPVPLSLGLLVANITYFGMSDEVSVFKSNSTFWPIYGSIVFLVLILFSCGTLVQSAICCTILGSFGVVLAIDYWAGFDLKYIIINIIRRLTVEDFNLAIISPPLQTADIWLCVFWIMLALFAINYKPVSYILIKSTGVLPKVSDVRGYRRVLPLKNTDRIYSF